MWRLGIQLRSALLGGDSQPEAGRSAACPLPVWAARTRGGSGLRVFGHSAETPEQRFRSLQIASVAHPRNVPCVLDPELIAFVRQRIKSVWTLELLLLLRRNSAQPILCSQLIRDMRATPGLIERGLRELGAAGLVVSDGQSARFVADSPDLNRLCEAMDTALRERPVAMRDVILSPTTRRSDRGDSLSGKDQPG